MSDFPLSHPSTPSRRNMAIAGGVVLFHVFLLWGLQTGLLRRVVETVVPVSLVSEIITPPVPQVEPPPPAPVQPRKPPTPKPAAKLAAVPDLAPTPNAPTGTVEPQPAPPPITA